MADLLIDGSIAALARSIGAGQTSAVAATQQCLRRIDERQPEVNAFISLERAGALVRAAAIDAAPGRSGALAGVPLAHKDMFHRAGRVSSCGSRMQGGPATVTASVLARLDEAGAIDLGGLNMSEFACNPFGFNNLAGPARNPFDRARTAGGSSSGSAAAVAARMVCGALGSDTGGSVRVPAALCGLHGLLPTRGLVPRDGAMKLSPSLDAIGPLARSAGDCALLFGVIAGLDAEFGARFASDRPAPAIAGRRIGVAMALEDRVTPEIAQAFEQAAERFRALGCVLVPKPCPDFAGLNALAAIVMFTEMAACHLPWLETQAGGYTPWIRERLCIGLGISGTDYVRALAVRAKVTRSFIAEHLADVDALLLPATPVVAPRLDEVEAVLLAGGSWAPDLGLFTRSTNYLGLPALAFPAGVSGAGLPIGLQVMGRPFAEATLFTLARAFEAAEAGARP